MQKPVACSLPSGDFDDRSRAWRELLEGRLLNRQPTSSGCVLALTAAPGVGEAARELAGLEAGCCPWLDVQVTETEVVTIRLSSSSPGGPEAIRELFQAG